MKPLPEDLETFAGTPMGEVMRMGPGESILTPDLNVTQRIGRNLRNSVVNPWSWLKDITQEPDPSFDFRAYARSRDVPADWLAYSMNQEHADWRIAEIDERRKIQQSLLSHQTEAIMMGLGFAMLSPENLALMAVNPAFAGRSALSRVAGMAAVGAGTNLAAEIPWQIRESERGWHDAMLSTALGAGFGGLIATPYAGIDSFRSWQRSSRKRRIDTFHRQMASEIGFLDSTLERVHRGAETGIGWFRRKGTEPARSERPMRRVRDAYRALHQLESGYVSAPASRRPQIQREIQRARKRVLQLERRYASDLAALPQVPRAIVRVPGTGEIAVRGVLGTDHPDLEHLGAAQGFIYPDHVYGVDPMTGANSTLGEWRFQEDELLVVHRGRDGDPSMNEIAENPRNREILTQAWAAAELAPDPGSKPEFLNAFLRRKGIRGIVTLLADGTRQVRLLDAIEPTLTRRLRPDELEPAAELHPDGTTRVPGAIARGDTWISRLDRDEFEQLIREPSGRVQAMTPPRRGPARRRRMMTSDEMERAAWKEAWTTGKVGESPEVVLRRMVPRKQTWKTKAGAALRDRLFGAIEQVGQANRWIDVEMDRLERMVDSQMSRVDDLPETSEQLSLRVRTMLATRRPATMRALRKMAVDYGRSLGWEENSIWRKQDQVVDYLIHHFGLDRPESNEREWNLGYLAHFMRESREQNLNMQDPSDTIMERRFIQIERAVSMALDGLREFVEAWNVHVKTHGNDPATVSVFGELQPGEPAPIGVLTHYVSLLDMVEGLLARSVGGEDTAKGVDLWNTVNLALHRGSGKPGSPPLLVLGQPAEGQIGLHEAGIRILEPFENHVVSTFGRPYESPKRSRDAVIEELHQRLSYLDQVRSGNITFRSAEELTEAEIRGRLATIEERQQEIRQSLKLHIVREHSPEIRSTLDRLRMEKDSWMERLASQQGEPQRIYDHVVANAQRLVQDSIGRIVNGARTYVAYTSIFDTSLSRRLREIRSYQANLARLRSEIEDFDHGFGDQIESVWNLLADAERQHLEWIGQGHRSPPTQVVRSQRERVQQAALTHEELFRLLQEDPRSFFRYVDDAEFAGLIDDLTPAAKAEVEQVVRAAMGIAEDEDRAFAQAGEAMVAESERPVEDADADDEIVGGFQSKGEVGRVMTDHQELLDQMTTWEELVPEYVRDMAREAEELRLWIDAFLRDNPGQGVPSKQRWRYSNLMKKLRSRLGDYEGIRSILPSRDQESATVYRLQHQEEADAQIHDWARQIDEAPPEEKMALFRQALEETVAVDEQTLRELMSLERRRQWDQLSEDEKEAALAGMEQQILVTTREIFQAGGEGRGVDVRAAGPEIRPEAPVREPGVAPPPLVAAQPTTVEKLIAGIGARQAAIRRFRILGMLDETIDSYQQGRLSHDEIASRRPGVPVLPGEVRVPEATEERGKWKAYIRKPFGKRTLADIYAAHRALYQPMWRQTMIVHGIRRLLQGVEDPRARLLQVLPDRMLVKLYADTVRSGMAIPASVKGMVDRTKAAITFTLQDGRALGTNQLTQRIARVRDWLLSERQGLPRVLQPPLLQREWARDLFRQARAAGVPRGTQAAPPSAPGIPRLAAETVIPEPMLVRMAELLPERTLRSLERLMELQDSMEELARNPTAADLGPRMKDLLYEYAGIWAQEMEQRKLPKGGQPRRRPGRTPRGRRRSMSLIGQQQLTKQRAERIIAQIDLVLGTEKADLLARRIQRWGLADASMGLLDFQMAVARIALTMADPQNLLSPPDQIVAAAFMRRAHELLGEDDPPEIAATTVERPTFHDSDRALARALAEDIDDEMLTVPGQMEQYLSVHSVAGLDDPTLLEVMPQLWRARPSGTPARLWARMLLERPDAWRSIEGVGPVRYREGIAIWNAITESVRRQASEEPELGPELAPRLIEEEAQPDDWATVAGTQDFLEATQEQQAAYARVSNTLRRELGRPLAPEEIEAEARTRNSRQSQERAAGQMDFEDLLPDEALVPEDLMGVPHTEEDEYAVLSRVDDPERAREDVDDDGPPLEDDFSEAAEGDEPGSVSEGEGEERSAAGAALPGRPAPEPAGAAAGGEGGGQEPPGTTPPSGFQDDRFGPIGHETGERLARVVGQDPSGLGRMNRAFPVWRMATSGFLSVRRMVQLLVDVPFVYEKHLRGEKSPESAQNFVQRTQVMLVESLRTLHDDFRAMTSDHAANRHGDVARRWYVWRSKRGLIPNLKMDWQTFVDRVGRARRLSQRPDYLALEPDPTIRRTAERMSRFYEFWEGHLIGPDKLMQRSDISAHRYLTVLWDNEKIAADLPGFRAALAEAGEEAMIDLSPPERGAFLEREINRILSMGQNRADEAAVDFRRRKPTLQRKIDDTHPALQPYLVNDMEAQLLYYHRTVAPDVGIFRTTGGDMSLRSFFYSLAKEFDESSQRISERIGARLVRMREIDATRTEALWRMVNQANRTTSDQAIRAALTQTERLQPRPPGVDRNAVWANELWRFLNGSASKEWKVLARQSLDLREQRRRLRKDYEWGVVDVVNTWAILRNMNTMPATIEGLLMRLGTYAGHHYGDTAARVLFKLREKWQGFGERIGTRAPGNLAVPQAAVSMLEEAQAPEFLLERIRASLPDVATLARSRRLSHQILVQDVPFMLRTLAYQTQGGFFAVSAMVDLAKNAFYFGIKNSLEPAYARLAGDMRAWNVNKQWAHEASAIVDVLLNHYVMTRWDVVDDAHQLTWAVDFGRRLNQSLAMVSGLVPLTQATRALSSILFLNHLGKVIPDLAAGRSSKADVARMSMWGIGQAEAQQLLPHLVRSETGTWVISPDEMEPQLKDKVYQAIAKAAHQLTVTPGPADLPWTSHGEWAKLILMYKSFTMSNHLRTFIQGLQLHDARVASWVLAALGLGALGYVLRRKADGNNIDGEEMVIASIERSGVLSLFWDASEWVGAFSNGAISPHTLIGAPNPAYWRSPMDELPISGALKHAGRAAMGAAKFMTFHPEDVRQAEINSLRKMIFFSGLPGVSMLFNAGADKVGAWTRTLKEREMPNVEVRGTWENPRFRATGRNLPPQVRARAKPGFDALAEEARRTHRLPDQLQARAILMDAWEQWAAQRQVFDETRRRVTP